MPNRIWLDKLLDRLANSRAASCLWPTSPSAKCVDLSGSGEVPELDSGLSLRGPGPTGMRSPKTTRYCHGWSKRPGVPGAPNPALVIPRGRKISLLISSSEELPVARSITAPQQRTQILNVGFGARYTGASGEHCQDTGESSTWQMVH